MQPVWPQTCDAWCQIQSFATNAAIQHIAIAIFSIAGLVLLFYRTRAMLRQSAAALAQAESAKSAAAAAAAQAETAKTSAKIAEKQAQIAWDGQLADRFIKTTPLLGADKINERLGAILALEEIAHQSDRHHTIIIELLAAFIREWVSKGLKLREGAGKILNSAQTDIALALQVIGRINSLPNRPSPEINLAQCDLSKYLISGNFSNAVFHDSLLNNTQFLNVNLSGAIFDEAEGQTIVGLNINPNIRSPDAARHLLINFVQKHDRTPFVFSLPAPPTTPHPLAGATFSSASALMTGFTRSK